MLCTFNKLRIVTKTLKKIKPHENMLSSLQTDRNINAKMCVSAVFHYEHAKNGLSFSWSVHKIICTEMFFFVYDTECWGTMA
jgi:hypothetical protein